MKREQVVDLAWNAWVCVIMIVVGGALTMCAHKRLAAAPTAACAKGYPVIVDVEDAGPGVCR